MGFSITDRDVLLVIDVQNDFCPGGALAVPNGDQVIPAVLRSAARFAHVILTQDWHPAGHHSFASSHKGRNPYETIQLPYGQQTLWPDHCVQDTRGAALPEALQLSAVELILRKGCRPEIDSYSAFQENDRSTKTGLAGYLRERGLERVFVAGLAYDYCVRYSAIDARKAGFATFVVEDGCRAIDLHGSVDSTRREFAAAGVSEILSSEI